MILGPALTIAGAVLTALAIVAPGPFLGAFLGPAFLVAGWTLIADSRARRRTMRILHSRPRDVRP